MSTLRLLVAASAVLPFLTLVAIGLSPMVALLIASVSPLVFWLVTALGSSPKTGKRPAG